MLILYEMGCQLRKACALLCRLDGWGCYPRMIIVIHAAAARDEHKNEGEKKAKVTELVWHSTHLLLAKMSAGCWQPQIPVFLLFPQPAMNGHYNHVYSHSATDPFSLLKHQHPNGRTPPRLHTQLASIVFLFFIPSTSFFFDFEILISAEYPFWLLFVCVCVCVGDVWA